MCVARQEQSRKAVVKNAVRPSAHQLQQCILGLHQLPPSSSNASLPIATESVRTLHACRRRAAYPCTVFDLMHKRRKTACVVVVAAGDRYERPQRTAVVTSSNTLYACMLQQQLGIAYCFVGIEPVEMDYIST